MILVGYMDKPDIKWHEISQEMKQHLSNAFGVTNEEEWTRMGAQICPLCPDPHHLLNRCLKVLASTESGKRVFGPDGAARRVQQVLHPKDVVSLVESMYMMAPLMSSAPLTASS